MNKIITLGLATLLLTACSEQEEYTQAVLEALSNDPDIKSYHLDPITVTDCIVDLSSKKMPGFSPFEPIRKASYVSYTKMIALKKSEKPQDVLNELQESFGSPQKLSEAHRNYSQSYLECISTITNQVLDKNESE